MTRLFAACLVGIPALWLVHWRMRSVRGRQVLLLIASYAFYLTFGLKFFAILLASTCFNFVWGGVLRRRPTASNLWVGILANVALLSVFKYLPSLAAALAGSSSVVAAVAHLALPVGISFWTFQGLSYLFDQYREENLDPTLLEFMLYMGFAPTVLSGPIARVPELLPQLRSRPVIGWENVTTGLKSIWIGLLMIALGRVLGGGISGHGINWGFEQDAARMSTSDVWVLLVGYGFQLFFDFAGYTRVAIGVAYLFGVRLPENFRRPFLATTPSVFWTRWHMTLSFWIRDYVFMPLATMRRGVWWRNAMLVFSMVVFGVWHKATLLFLLWGTYQGVLLLVHRLIQQWQRKRGVQTSGAQWSAISWLVTFAAITLGWILFRAQTLSQASTLLAGALVPSGHASVLPGDFYVLVLALALAYFALAKWEERDDSERSVLAFLPIELRYICYAGIAYLAFFRAAEPQAFIYFQF